MNSYTSDNRHPPSHETIFLTTHWSQADWEAQYLLILSYLNFDRPLNLVLLPGAAQECTWSDQQWQALALYGLDRCYHIKELAPIESQAIGWPAARLLIVKVSQPLLHICHWKNRTHFENWLPMVSKDDTLLMFGNTCQHDALWISHHWPNNQQHIVNETEHPHISPAHDDTIDPQHWTKLIIQNPTILTWS